MEAKEVTYSQWSNLNILSSVPGGSLKLGKGDKDLQHLPNCRTRSSSYFYNADPNFTKGFQYSPTLYKKRTSKAKQWIHRLLTIWPIHFTVYGVFIIDRGNKDILVFWPGYFLFLPFPSNFNVYWIKIDQCFTSCNLLNFIPSPIPNDNMNQILQYNAISSISCKHCLFSQFFITSSIAANVR